MMIRRCPGMDPANFKPEDIKLNQCVNCHKEIEFWKDDIKVKCPFCGHINFNPNLGNTCLVWCKEAARCIDNDDITEWQKKNKDKIKQSKR